nr:ribonuclease H-like domain-containing protein [Tanacetum cinerariifolium]
MTTDTTSGEKSRRTVTLTAEDMQRKKNDVKARTTLLLSLPDEHQLRFNKYKTAQELWAAILKTFGGNEATKKTKKNLLKQQYGNFKPEGSKTLEQTFTRLQVIIGQLSDLDTISLDDLYNHLKVYESKVQKKSEPNSQNMAFISSAKHSNRNEDGNTICVPTASTNVSTASASVATISQDTACAYIASQSSGSQIKFEDINQIDEDDMEEMDIKWNMALLSMREDKFWKKIGKKISIQGLDVAGAPRSLDRGRRENYRQGSKAEEQALKALMAIDGVGWDWSYMENDEEDHALVADEVAPTEFALMANTSAESKDSGCSRHMTGNISYLSDYESFGQGGCKIIGKGTIKTECIMLGKDFKLLDDANILLRTPRHHNMYSIDLNNIVPHRDLTCLVAKASADECMLWHKRLGHLNFKTMNELVRHNLVRGLPTKCFENDHTCTACLKGKQHKASSVGTGLAALSDTSPNLVKTAIGTTFLFE